MTSRDLIAREFDSLVEAQKVIHAQLLSLPVEQFFSD